MFPNCSLTAASQTRVPRKVIPQNHVNVVLMHASLAGRRAGVPLEHKRPGGIGQTFGIPQSDAYMLRASNSRQGNSATKRSKSLQVRSAVTQEAPAKQVTNLGRETGGVATAQKTRVVVLGSGWGAISYLKALPKHIKDSYDITVISPRNYFLFTALLPAVAAGFLEERSIIESIRKILRGKGTYFEAAATDIDPKRRIVKACFPRHAGLEPHSFDVPYDILIVSVGSITNTFNIEGIKEHAMFFKSIEDAAELRQRVCECFERAALPDTPDEEVERLLSFVIVGGGPSGVEVAAEIYDLIQQDLKRYYPELVKRAQVRLVELQDHLLSTYDRAISDYTHKLFQRTGIEAVLNTKVQRVSRGVVTVVDKEKRVTELPFGACVWASGIAMHPLARVLAEKLPEGNQTHFRSLVTDQYLRVKGSGGFIYALGDAATIEQPRALEHSQELFRNADANQDGTLTLRELRDLLSRAAKEYSHLQEFARLLDTRNGVQRFGGLMSEIITGDKQPLPEANGAGPAISAGNNSNGGKNGAGPQGGGKPRGRGSSVISEDIKISEQQFHEMLQKMEAGLRALPATGQVAGQQGEYLARLFAKNDVRLGQELPQSVRPFRYVHRGSLAYVGGDKAVMDIPNLGPLTGYAAGFLWRSFETFRQVSWRNRFFLVGDFLRTKVFGRDIEFGRLDVESEASQMIGD